MSSIAERIAALEVSHLGRQQPLDQNYTPRQIPQNRTPSFSVSAPEDDSHPPARPPRPAPPSRLMSDPAQGGQLFQSLGANTSIGNLPAKQPPPTPHRAEKKPLPMPPPRVSQYSTSPPSQDVQRRLSTDSTTSTLSNRSALSSVSTISAYTTESRRPSLDKRGEARGMAPAYDPLKLPALPPRRQSVEKPTLNKSYSQSVVPVVAASAPPPLRITQGPPPLPARRSLPQAETQVPQVLAKPQPKLPARPTVQANGALPAPDAKKSALSFGMNKNIETPSPSIPQRPTPAPGTSATTAPPPIPTASRPNFAQVQASKPKVTAPRPANAQCMKCRDFREVDAHAARFPKEAIPSTDISWLSHQLTSPFSSPTDKARAIFTWLHHNIDYNCPAFFSGNIKPSTPASTIASGLAVCEGYAALFAALALAAGLESVVVSGHGKGFGHRALQPGEPVPAFNCGHAWNAVKIDNGEWKLIDPCWGAGHTSDDHQYHRKFSPQQFTMDNNEFGLSHFPQNSAYFFRTDGRATIPWEEYMVGSDSPGENVTTFTGTRGEHGISETSVLPRKKHIRISGMPPKQRIQFMFTSVCDHWIPEVHGTGKPYVFILDIGGKDGRDRDTVVFQTNGTHWWCDVAIENLGAPGQTLNLWAVTSVASKNARGLTPDEYNKTVKRRKAVGYEGVAAWQLV